MRSLLLAFAALLFGSSGFANTLMTSFIYEGQIESSSGDTDLDGEKPSQVVTASIARPDGCGGNLGLTPHTETVTFVDGKFRIKPQFNSVNLNKALDPRNTFEGACSAPYANRILVIEWNSKEFKVDLADAPRASVAHDTFAIGGVPIEQNMTCQSGYFLRYDGTSFQCKPIALTDVADVANLGLGGDLSGSVGAASVVKIRGQEVASTNPAAGQVLKFVGDKWAPSGTIESVSSANGDIAVANGNSSPILTLNSAAAGGSGSANKIAKLDANGRLAVSMIPGLDVAQVTAGILPIIRGGTNSSTALTNNKVMVSTSGAIEESAVTSTELGYLTGVTSSIQTQINSKQNALGYTPLNKAGDTMTGALNLPSNGLAVGTNQLVVSGGNVGIGQASPATRLDVAGGVRIGSEAANCVSTLAGTLRFDTATSNVQFCNGSLWQGFGIAGAGLTSLNGSVVPVQTFSTPSTTGTALSWSTSAAAGSHTLNIPMASNTGVTAGLISKTDYDSFNNRLNSPLTTKGDLLTRTNTSHERLPAGANGQILSADSATPTGLKWITPASGTITSVTAGTGLTGGGTSGPVTLGVDAGLSANKIPQVGGTAIAANGVVVANGTATALTSLNCSSGQVVKFNSGIADCANDNDTTALTVLNGGNSFGTAATLGTNDNFALNFETNNNTHMTITNGGFVGIGTSNPDSKLHVKDSTTEIKMNSAGVNVSGGGGVSVKGGGTGVSIYGSTGTPGLRVFTANGTEIPENQAVPNIFTCGIPSATSPTTLHGSLGANDSNSGEIACPNAAPGQIVVCTPQTQPSDGVCRWTAYVENAAKVKIRLTNTKGGGSVPCFSTNPTWKCIVFF